MPFDGALDLIVNYYGIIPVNRGQLDRKAMSKAVSVLEQKRIFGGDLPEGGDLVPRSDAHPHWCVVAESQRTG